MARPTRIAIPRPSWDYLLALGLVALVVALVPVAYLAFVSLVGWAVYLYAVHAAGLITAFPFVGPALYVGPLLAGVVLVVFTLKPFLARRPASPGPFSVTRAEEPRLVAFIEELCELVDAPRPARIDVDLSPNASAGLKGFALRRGNLVVSFGLPLAAALSTQQLASILVHELAHCRQGTALRLHRVTLGINTWLARVVFERDSWDEALSESSIPATSPFSPGTTSVSVPSMLGLVLLPAVASVAVTRYVLRGLLWAGHAASAGLSRRMEIEADRISALVVGSETAVETLRVTPGLELALARLESALNQQSHPRRAPDDLVECATLYLAALTASELRQVEERISSRSAGRLDTHPSVSTRVRLMRDLHAPGVLHHPGPARELFTDFERVCKVRTRLAYERASTLDDLQVVPAAQFTAGIQAAGRDRAVQESFFGKDCILGFETLPSAAERRASEIGTPRALLDAALARMSDLRGEARGICIRFENAWLQQARLLAAAQACDVDAAFEAGTFGLSREDIVESATLADAISSALADNAEERRRVSADIAPFRRAATDAVAAALARFDAQVRAGHGAASAVAEIDLLGAVLNAFHSHAAAMQEAYAHLNAIGYFLSGARPPGDGAAQRAVTALVERAWELMATGVDAIRAVPVSPASVADARVVECHEALMSVEVRSANVFLLAPLLLAFDAACSSRLLCVLDLVGAAGPAAPEPTTIGAAGGTVAEPPSTQPRTHQPGPAPALSELQTFRRALARRQPTLVATPVLIAIALFSMAFARGDPRSLTLEMLLRSGASFRPLIVAGEWWRLLTATFLSEGAFQFAVLVLALTTIGRTAERVFGGVAFLAYYLVIGTLMGLASVLASDSGVFATSSAAVMGVGAAVLSVAVGLTTSGQPEDTTRTVPPLDFPAPAVAAIYMTLVLLGLSALFSNTLPMHVIAAFLGLFCARVTASNALVGKPSGGQVAVLALLAAIALGIGAVYLAQQRDFRSEGFAFIVREQRAVNAFSAGVAWSPGRPRAAGKRLDAIVDRVLAESAGAQGRAARLRATFEAEQVANRRLDRYGRNPNWRRWLWATNQLMMGAAYDQYLQSRAAVWRSRLTYAKARNLETLDRLNAADTHARTMLVRALAREESTYPP